MFTYSYSDMNSLIKESYYKYIQHDNYLFSNISDSRNKQSHHIHRLLWATDFDINERNRIGVRYVFSSNDLTGRQFNNNTIIDDKQETKRRINQIGKTENSLHSISLDYNYNTGENSSLSFVTDYAFRKSNRNGKTEEQMMPAGAVSETNILNRSRYNVYTASLKYVFKLSTGWIADVGTKYSDVHNPSSIVTDYSRILEEYADRTRLNDRVAAGYFSLSKEWNSFDWELGLRYEYAKTRIRSFSEEETQEVNRSYSDMFPKLDINYRVNDDLNFSLSASRLISRPGFRDLDPNISYEDSLSYVGGNPYVKPSYYYTVSISGQWKNLSLSIDYTKAKNEIEQTVISSDENPNATQMIPINLPKSEKYRAGLQYVFNHKKMNAYISAGINLPHQKIPYMDGTRKVKKLSWDCSASCEYLINPAFSVYGNFFYNSSNEKGLTYQYSVNALNVGVRGIFLNKKLIANLYGTDLLYGSHFNNLYDRYLNIKSGTKGKGDFRGVMLSVSYVLFNSNRVSIKGQRGNLDVLDRTE